MVEVKTCGKTLLFIGNGMRVECGVLVVLRDEEVIAAFSPGIWQEARLEEEMEQTKSPGTIVSDPTVGTVPWTTPENAAATDEVNADAGALNTTTFSEYLKATNFGFSLPVNAIVRGIVATVTRTASSFAPLDYRVRIVKGGVIGSEDKSTTAPWSTVGYETATYAGKTDLWGETWTADDTNSADFGVAIAAKGSDGFFASNANVDHIQLTVHFGTPTQLYNEVTIPSHIEG
jgi:hypothetical protein